MDLEKIITELTEKRFNDKINEIINGRFDENRGLFETSDFDRKLQNFIFMMIEEILQEKKEIIKNKLLQRMDIDNINIDLKNINITLIKLKE